MTFAEASGDDVQKQRSKEEENTTFWKYSTFFLLNILFMSISLLTIVGFLIMPAITSSEASLSCAFEAPNINLNQMHEEIRSKLLSEEFTSDTGAILMHGGYVTYRYNTDVEEDFRQESNFWYISGYDQPNGTIIMDIYSGSSYLFIPFQPVDYAVWNGVIETPESVRAKYGFTDVYYHEDLSYILSLISNNDPSYVIFVYDSFVDFPDKSSYTVNSNRLPIALNSRRAVKTQSELELMRYAAKVSSDAHRLVMNHTTYGNYEYNAEGKFLDGCFSCGLTVQAYLPICASGNNSAILHYNDNNRLMQNGDFLLIDAGAEYFGYAADITRTYPVNGTFSINQTLVYNMVLSAQTRVIQALRVGKNWASIQTDCKQFICEELVANGFLSSTVSECQTLSLSYYFFPHGVSHMLGLDVHDPRDPTTYTLVAGNVLTVEPGIYFNNALFEIAFADPNVSKYMVKEKIVPLLESQFGGVRIEDIVIIHDTYVEVISDAPRTIFEIESLMDGTD